MARKLRLEFPGACYHIINRGNYRADVFRAESTKLAFERCLFAACQRSGWLLHAFVIMRNHYHLAIETPQGNLVPGMQWLQATFANRFNRLRGERGHLFQGRYKALLVEEGDPLGQVAHYIHLNPVRAGVLQVAALSDYRFSSYWYLHHPRERPAGMVLDRVLAQTGGLADTPAGRASYHDYLAWQATEGPFGRSQAYVSLSQGWALGSAGFKTALVQDHRVAALSRAWEQQGAREIREQGWERLCRQAMAALRRTDDELLVEMGCVPWKIALATLLKERTQASNRWLGGRLHIGCAKYVGRLIAEYQQTKPVPQLLAELRGLGET